jgi:hypothetical protein
MTAEAIGKVIRDFQRGQVDTRAARVELEPSRPGIDMNRWFTREMDAVAHSTVVDVTALWRQIIERDEPRALYESHLLLPPWLNASYCFVNSKGNVHVMNALSLTIEEYAAERWKSDVDTHDLDWDEVAWVTAVTVWLGGRSESVGGPIRTQGPMHAWLWAIRADGVPLDLRWVHVRQDIEMEMWTNALLVVLAAVDFLNCRNVQLVEPVRPRAERKRVERTGVRVHEINVLPVGKTTRSRPGESRGVPLTSVRGHFATYGQDGRGLLFGKYAGRYWIPQHARGSAEHGVVAQEFRLEAEA